MIYDYILTSLANVFNKRLNISGTNTMKIPIKNNSITFTIVNDRDKAIDAFPIFQYDASLKVWRKAFIISDIVMSTSLCLFE